MRDVSTLLWIAGASCVLVPIALLIRAAWKAADDLADDIPDWDRAIDHCGWIDIPTDTTGYSFPRPVETCRGVHRGAPALVAAPFHSRQIAPEGQHDHA